MNLRPSASLRRACSLGVTAALLLPVLASAAFGAEAPAKPYTLYSGSNFSLEWNGHLYPIQGADHEAFVIVVDGKRVLVRGEQVHLKITSEMKMSTEFATLTDVKADRAYTDAADPSRIVDRAMENTTRSTMALDTYQGAINNAQIVRAYASAQYAGSLGGGTGETPTGMSPADVSAAQKNTVMSVGSSFEEMNGLPAATLRAQTERDKQLFDAFKLTFELSTRTPLEDPYLIVLVKARENPKDPKSVRLVVYGKSLPPIGAGPKKVEVSQGGFPVGYLLDGYQIHLFNGGVEIPTSGASQQIALNAADAFQYYTVEYTVRNAGKTVAASPAKSFWPGDEIGKLPTDLLNRPLFVKVDKNGRASGIYEDESCSRPVRNDDLEGVWPKLYFHPALSAGKPIETVLSITLAKAAG